MAERTYHFEIRKRLPDGEWEYGLHMSESQEPTLADGWEVVKLLWVVPNAASGRGDF